MKLAATQINCTVGEISDNLDKHYVEIKIAIKNDVQLIIFPEMSITGYCREEAEQLVFTENDRRLDKLKELAKIGDIIIIVGAPIKIKEKCFIGSFVIHPDESVSMYTKQYLHDGEELFFSSSMDYNPIINIGNERISLAICADINNENHPCNAKKNNCTIYLPSIFYSTAGMDEAYEQLRNYAEKYSLHILMSNYVGELWQMTSGGKSAFWNSKGALLGNLGSNDQGLLIIEKTHTIWSITKLVTTVNS